MYIPLKSMRNCASSAFTRSEERRVGKECRSRRSPYHYKKKRIALLHPSLRGCDIRPPLQKLRRHAEGNGRRALFFFFQAEDGIRDRDVTGVQTCALPI